MDREILFSTTAKRKLLCDSIKEGKKYVVGSRDKNFFFGLSTISRRQLLMMSNEADVQ